MANETKLQSVTLEIKRYVTSVLIDGLLSKYSGAQLDAKVYDRLDIFAHQLTMSLDVAGKTLRKEEVLVPANAWEHFKKDYFPNWLLVKYPAKVTKITITLDEIYPEMKIPTRAERVLMRRDFKVDFIGQNDEEVE